MMFESLESRTLMSVTLSDTGVLTIEGTQHSDRIGISARKGFYLVTYNGHVLKVVLGSKVHEIDIFGGRGNDYISARQSKVPVLISGGDGNDHIFGGHNNDTISGGVGNDHINGESGDDVILGNDGDDVINGGAGNDFLSGGAGADKIDGGADSNAVLNPTESQTIKNATPTDTKPANLFIPDETVPVPSKVGFDVVGGEVTANLRFTLPAGSQLTFGQIRHAGRTIYLDVLVDTHNGDVNAPTDFDSTFNLGRESNLIGGNHVYTLVLETPGGFVTVGTFTKSGLT
jgi:Ca2+-binding RTX toxin-like protein